jgi:hypothetical protein
MAGIVATGFSSLDRVMEAPREEDFKYPGWSFEFDRGEDGNQFKLDEALASEALLSSSADSIPSVTKWNVVRRLGPRLAVPGERDVFSLEVTR